MLSLVRALRRQLSRCHRFGIRGGARSVAAAVARRRRARRYPRWVSRALAERRSEPPRVALGEGAPRFTIVLPVSSPKRDWLRDAIDSVRRQSYSGWELVVVDDASDPVPSLGELGLEPGREGGAIRWLRSSERLGIAAASNRAAASGNAEWILFLDHDDVLDPGALARVAERAVARDVEVIYSDEDKIGRDGAFCDPAFKPPFSSELLLSNNYIGHLVALRRSRFDALGGLRSEFDGAQDYDLMLRLARAEVAFAHIPETLYHWRISDASVADPAGGAKAWAFAAGQRCLEAHLSSGSEPCRVSAGVAPGYFQIDWGGTTPPPYAVVSFCGETDGGAALGSGDDAGQPVLIFQEESLTPFSEHAYERLARHLVRDRVGVAGAAMISRSGALLHAGIATGGQDPFRSAATGWMMGDPGPMGLLACTRQASAVAGGVLAIAPETLRELGGFDPTLRADAAFVDLCFRARRAGYDVIYEPRAVFQARGETAPVLRPQERELLAARFPQALEPDAFVSARFLSSGPLFEFPF